jgi:hypothetical protein
MEQSDGTRKQLVLLELNEINFDVVPRYLDRISNDGLRRLLAGAAIQTRAENRYEEIEPWIQWASVHTGKSFAEHQLFRLGDIVGAPVAQLFEQLEESGLRVGCLSPMNTENRLRSPAYFVPDPWTATPSDGSWWSRHLATAVSQVVNDNAHRRIDLRSAATLALGLVRFARPSNYDLYFRLAAFSRGAPWRNALLLDLLLHDVHMHLFRRCRPDFSTIFLNAGAHIQHHYFFNSRAIDSGTTRNPSWYAPADADPVGEMLAVYDRIVTDYLNLSGIDLMVATGLSQLPYDRVKFYYRFKDHSDFLRQVGIKHSEILPRMTRDFLIRFDTRTDAITAKAVLAAAQVEGTGIPLFTEIDDRGLELFVTLTYPDEVDASLRVRIGDHVLPLAPHVSFVAIKNGMHQAKGFAFFTPRINEFAPADGAHVKSLYTTIMRYFNAVPTGA